MSHFTVAVISKQRNQVEGLLAPFDENLEIESVISETYDEIMSSARELQTKYRNYSNHDIAEHFGKHMSSSLSTSCLEFALNLYDQNPSEDNDDYEKFVNIINKNGETYDFKSYVRDAVQLKNLICAANDDELFEAYRIYNDTDMSCVDENKNFTYMMNPNAKWDWWQVGGRWENFIKLNDIGVQNNHRHFADSAQIKEIDFSVRQKDYDYAMRFWQINIEGDELKEGERKDDFFCFYKPEWYKERYHDAETYATAMSTLNTYAVVLPDGTWCGKGNMGWFGMSDESHDEALEWELHFYDRFLKDLNPEYYVTIVDCHI